jgi:hypothetical protein
MLVEQVSTKLGRKVKKEALMVKGQIFIKLEVHK